MGLSLSYDIINAHNDALSAGSRGKVETLSAEAAAQAGKEEEGSEFVITLNA